MTDAMPFDYSNALLHQLWNIPQPRKHAPRPVSLPPRPSFEQMKQDYAKAYAEFRSIVIKARGEFKTLDERKPVVDLLERMCEINLLAGQPGMARFDLLVLNNVHHRGSTALQVYRDRVAGEEDYFSLFPLEKHHDYLLLCLIRLNDVEKAVQMCEYRVETMKRELETLAKAKKQLDSALDGIHAQLEQIQKHERKPNSEIVQLLELKREAAATTSAEAETELLEKTKVYDRWFSIKLYVETHGSNMIAEETKRIRQGPFGGAHTAQTDQEMFRDILVMNRGGLFHPRGMASNAEYLKQTWGDMENAQLQADALESVSRTTAEAKFKAGTSDAAVTIAPSDESDKARGVGIFATREFQKDEVIFREPAVLRFTLNHAACAYCFQGHETPPQEDDEKALQARLDEMVPCPDCKSERYCSEQCRGSAYTAWHKWACRSGLSKRFVETRFHAINAAASPPNGASSHAAAMIMQLLARPDHTPWHSDVAASIMLMMRDIYDSPFTQGNKERWIDDLRTYAGVMSSVESKLGSAQCDFYSYCLLRTGIEQIQTGVGSARTKHGGIASTAVFRSSRYFNHACMPNVTREIDRDPDAQEIMLTVRASRRIHPGEELFIAYGVSANELDLNTRAMAMRDAGVDPFPTAHRCLLCAAQLRLKPAEQFEQAANSLVAALIPLLEADTVGNTEPVVHDTDTASMP